MSPRLSAPSAGEPATWRTVNRRVSLAARLGGDAVGQFFGSAEVQEHGHLGVDDLFGSEIVDLGPGVGIVPLPPSGFVAPRAGHRSG